MVRSWFPILGLYALITLAAAILLLPTFMSYTERDPLVYTNQPFPVVNSPITPGQEILVEVGRCNWSGGPLSYIVHRSLVDTTSGGKRSLIPERGSMIAGGCEKTISTLTDVPDGTRPGHYVIEGVAVAAGKWKTTSVPFVTGIFEVMDETPPGEE